MAFCITRPFVASDIYKLNEVNLDPFTENFGSSYYLNFLAKCPGMCLTAEAYDGRIMGYILGNLDNKDDVCFAHICAVSVAPQYRGRGVASELLQQFERAGFALGAEYVDLFVKETNKAAIRLYESRGYKVHRVVKKYYSKTENAYDMRVYASSSRNEKQN